MSRPEQPPAVKRNHRDEEKWQERLTEIDMRMFRQTLGYAAKNHVYSHGYAPCFTPPLPG